MSVYNKLHAIMAEFPSVPKAHVNSFHKYSYRSADDILAALKPLLVKHGVLMAVSGSDVKTDTLNESILTTVEMTVTFWDPDDLGPVISCRAFGQGVDKGDKGVYKAITGALKYALLTNFLIPGSEDPEQDSPTITPSPEPVKEKTVSLKRKD